MSKIILCFLLISLILTNVFASSNHNFLSVSSQEKNKYVKLQISDQNNSSLPKPIEYLKSLDDKIIDAIYEKENSYLTDYFANRHNRDHNRTILQTKHNYLVLEFGDVKSIILNELISELESYDDKVAEVFYDSSSRRLTIYYTNLIKLDDLLQIVTRHDVEFTKVAGTGIQ